MIGIRREIFLGRSCSCIMYSKINQKTKKSGQCIYLRLPKNWVIVIKFKRGCIKMWKWENDSILYSKSPYVPTKDIFQAVCNEIGRYYHGKEIQYLKSKKELKWKGFNLWCKLGFRSSHSNIRGEWVNLEIVTSLFATDLSDMERKGVLNFGMRPKNFNVYQIDSNKFDEIIVFIDHTIKAVKELDTKEGMEKFFLTMPKSVFIERDTNNLQYLNKLGLNS